MTKEDAINLLRANVMVACDTSVKVGYGTPLNRAIEDALDMAIKALEQQSSDETIKHSECDTMDALRFAEIMKKQRLQVVQPNSTQLIFEQMNRPTSDDCVSRQAVLAIANDSCLDLDSYEDTKEFCEEIKNLPPVTPTHGTCKDCKHRPQGLYCNRFMKFTNASFYCADFEKRGSENE